MTKFRIYEPRDRARRVVTICTGRRQVVNASLALACLMHARGDLFELYEGPHGVSAFPLERDAVIEACEVES
jgi:hypothetical protein